jgi:hypothetical protein
MRYILILLFYFGLTVSSVNAATVKFYDDLTVFNSKSSTSLTDFEGIVGDSGSSSASSFTIDGNTYSNVNRLNNVVICGATAAPCAGDSAFMYANGSLGGIRVILDSGITAVGGLFGDLNGPAEMGTLRVFGSDGSEFATQTVNYGDMLAGGEPPTFFGWTTTDTVFTALEFSLAVGFEPNKTWSAVDNFQFGQSLSQVPIPASIWLFGTALVGFVGMARRRKVA